MITGLGVVSPVGHSVPEFWNALLEGRSGIDYVRSFPTESFSVRIGGEVRDFDPSRWMEPKEARRHDRFAQFALAAAAQAVEDAGLDFEQVDRARCGVVLGTGIGGLRELEVAEETFQKRGPDRVSPFFVPKIMMNAAPGHIAIRYRLGGPNFSTASACASANHAMGMALRLIQCGDADLLLTGGTEAALTHLGLAAFANMQALSRRNDEPQKASRPFDLHRDGFVLAEGAGVLVFEEYEHARRRGARIYAEVLGFGQSDDAYHITAPDPDGSGAALAIRRCLEDAGLRPEQVSYINAHGTSTKLNDISETLAIKQVFGAHARRVPVSSTKSMIGHLLGAAAAVELVATVLSVYHDRIHPTINYETPDPQCDLDYVPNRAREVRVEAAISNSLGFGGHNSCIAVGKPRG